MKLIFFILILSSSFAVATELMSAKEAREAAKEHYESIRAAAESDLNLRVQERIDKNSNEGGYYARVEILFGEDRFVNKVIKKLRTLGYKAAVKTADQCGLNTSCIAIEWEK